MMTEDKKVWMLLPVCEQYLETYLEVQKSVPEPGIQQW